MKKAIILLFLLIGFTAGFFTGIIMLERALEPKLTNANIEILDLKEIIYQLDLENKRLNNTLNNNNTRSEN